MQQPTSAADAASLPATTSVKPPLTKVLIEHDHTTGNATMSLLDDQGNRIGNAMMTGQDHGDWLDYLIGMVVQVALSMLVKRK